MWRRCRVCNEQCEDRLFVVNRHQADTATCARCRHREQQVKLNKGLDISGLLRRWPRAQVREQG